MDVSKASNDLLADTYVHLQDDLVALESGPNDEMGPIVGELSDLITRVQDKVRARDIDEQGLRDRARK